MVSNQYCLHLSPTATIPCAPGCVSSHLQSVLQKARLDEGHGACTATHTSVKHTGACDGVTCSMYGVWPTQDVAIELEVGDATSLPTAARKLVRVVSAVPRMEAFIAEVRSLVFVCEPSPCLRAASCGPFLRVQGTKQSTACPNSEYLAMVAFPELLPCLTSRALRPSTPFLNLETNPPRCARRCTRQESPCCPPRCVAAPRTPPKWWA